MVYLGHPHAVYELDTEAQLDTMAWAMARQGRDGGLDSVTPASVRDLRWLYNDVMAARRRRRSDTEQEIAQHFQDPPEPVGA
mgnify:CR=1 FL=1